MLVLIGLVGFILGIIGALTSVKILIMALGAAFALAIILMNYQRAVYLLALYPLLYGIMVTFFKDTLLLNVWDELLFVFCIMVWFYKWFVHRNEKAYSWTPLEFPLLFFFGISFFLLFANSPQMRVGIDGLRAVIEYMLAFFIVVQLLRSEDGVKRLVYTMILACTVMGLHGIYQYVVGVEMPPEFVDKAEGDIVRVFSFVGNPNVLGVMMLAVIPLAVSLIFSEDKIGKKLILGGASAVMLACMVLTLSRSTWIGFAVAMFIFAFIKDKRLLVALGLTAVLVYMFVPAVQSRISYLLSPKYIISSLVGGRLGRWPQAIKMIKENTWLGVGLGRFGGAVASAYRMPGTFYIDNYYLNIAVQMGMTGFMGFCVLLYNVLAWASRSYAKLRSNTLSGNITLAALCSICGILVTNLFLNNFDAPMVTTYFWILVGICAYTGYALERAKEPSDKGAMDTEDARIVEA